MSIEDDVALLERVPTLRVLGTQALRVLAIGCEQRDFGRDQIMFSAGEPADSGFVVQRGAFRITGDHGKQHEMIARPGTLIGELALIMAMPRPSTVTAIEFSTAIRISRSLFQRVLDSDPAAAVRLRDEFAMRASQLSSDIVMVSSRLTS